MRSKRISHVSSLLWAAVLTACLYVLSPASLKAQQQQNSPTPDSGVYRLQPLSVGQTWQVPAADTAFITLDGISLAERLVIELLRQAGAKRDYTWETPQPLSSGSALTPVRSYRGVYGEYYLVTSNGRLYWSDSGGVREIGPFSPDAIAYFESNIGPNFVVTFDSRSMGVFVALRSPQESIAKDGGASSTVAQTLRVKVVSGTRVQGYEITAQASEPSLLPPATQSPAPPTSTPVTTGTTTPLSAVIPTRTPTTPTRTPTLSPSSTSSTPQVVASPTKQVSNITPLPQATPVPAVPTSPPTNPPAVSPTAVPSSTKTAVPTNTPEPSKTPTLSPTNPPATAAPVCGDRKVDPPQEECDDGPTCLNGDPCNPNEPASCGVILGDNQRCRVRNGDGCSAACLIEKCGNKRIDAGEECDDGNTISGDGCSASCLLQICGNGRTEEGEECDPGGTCVLDDDKPCPLDGVCDSSEVPCLPNFHATCSTSCQKKRRCGDGFTEEDLGEECDDGNERNGDGCDQDCRREECGNGLVQSGEQCDDGNKIPADGCDEYCNRTCGNGRVDPGEDCDPGSVCPNGKICTGNEEVCPGECHRIDDEGCDERCLGLCGNGVKDPGEECDAGRQCSFSGVDCTAPKSICPSQGDLCLTREAQGCTRTCSKKRCGNGILEPLGADEAPGKVGVDDNADGTVDDPKEIGYPGTDDEECEANSADCNSSTCKRARCGDGVVNSPSEQCDSLFRCTNDDRPCRSPDDCPGFLNSCDSGARPRCRNSGRLCLDPGSQECGPKDQCSMPPGWSSQNSCDTQCRATCGNGRWDAGEDKKCDLGSHCIKVTTGSGRESLSDCTQTGSCPAGERCVPRPSPRCVYCRTRGR